jgi:arginyl-tRNA synthetase
LIHQFVTITQGGEVVKMSTRKANFITLDELMEEVGADVVRYFFLMRTITSHLNFDLAIAKEQSDENPVYYVQYAHARICSIMRKSGTASEGFAASEKEVQLLTHPSEMTLLRALSQFPDVVKACSETFEPHHLTDYLHGLAGIFHRFYTECTVIGEDQELTHARLALCQATRTVLANGFSVLGISAPEKM